MMAIKMTAPFLVLVSLLGGIENADAFGFSVRQARRTTSLSMSSALIVQNKGGGHGELGFQLAKRLQSNPAITSITILQDDACNFSKEPFCLYATDIPDVTVVLAPIGSDDSLTSEKLQEVLGADASFDYVWDNASKGASGAGKGIVDCAKSWNSKLLTYVSSAGMYQPDADTVFPMVETTPIKDSAGQAKFEAYAVETGLPFVSFRPQYIYGPKSNKYDYIDWYFDRLVRGLTLPIPESGSQKVSLTNSEDVACLLSSVVDATDAAVSQRFFNCGTDELIGYDELAHLCADAAGIAKDNVKIQHYDPVVHGKGTFPFRMTDFYVAPDMAKEKLGWAGPKAGIAESLKWYFEGYKARGGPDREVDFTKDLEILGVSA